jgi:hypothetical protein
MASKSLPRGLPTNNYLSIFCRYLIILANLVVMICLVLVLFKQVNFYSFLKLPAKNNFLDLILSGSDLLIIPLLIKLNINIYFNKKFKNPDSYKTKFYYTLAFSFGIWLFGSSIVFSYLQTPILTLLLQSIRILAWFVILPKLPNNLKITLGLYSIFDHLLISSSIPIVLVYLLFWPKQVETVITSSRDNPLLSSLSNLKKNWLKNWKKYLIVSILGLNLVTSCYQVGFGKSLGIFGEPVLNVKNQKETARQNQLLRGYGLTQHPNILGFVNLIILVWINQKLQQDELKLKKTPKIFKIITVLSIFCIILSFSRLAFIGLFLLWWYYILTSQKKQNWLSIFRTIFGFGLILGWFSFTRKDFYRVQDWQLWLDVYSKIPLPKKLLGSGYYPEYLYRNFGNLESWRWQPNHSVWTNILFEFGFVGLVFALALLYYSFLVYPQKNWQLFKFDPSSGIIWLNKKK